jgi:hypothetical protein
VFVNTVTVAKELGETLHAVLEEAAAGAGEDGEGAAPRPMHVIHKEIPAYLRSEALAAFKGEPDAVLVRPAHSPVVPQKLWTRSEPLDAADPPCAQICTDMAARGLDVQDVGHVVQYQFAANAVPPGPSAVPLRVIRSRDIWCFC